MRKAILVIHIFFCCFAFGQQKIAIIKENKIRLVVDTVKLKKYVKYYLFPDSDKISIDKVEIRKQKMLMSEKEYFMILFHDFENEVKIAKWLSLKGKKLIMKNNLKENDLFEAVFLTCSGSEDCFPNIFEMDGSRNWTCGELTMHLGEEQIRDTGCIISRSLFPKNFKPSQTPYNTR